MPHADTCWWRVARRYVRLRRDNEWVGLWPDGRAEDLRWIDAYGESWRAATKLQAIYRAKVARRKAREAREQQLMLVRATNTHHTAVPSRCTCADTTCGGMCVGVSVGVCACVRVFVVQWVAKKAQAWFRGRQARKLAVVLKLKRRREEEAAIMLQAHYRKKMARRELRRRQHEEYQKLLNHMARKMQRLWKGKVMRDMASAALMALRAHKARMAAAASLVQRNWRGHVGRRLFRLTMQASILLKQRKQANAVKLQALYRGRLARQEARRRKHLESIRGDRETRAAVRMQAIIRGRRGRRLALRRAMEMELREQAALFIQTRWRSRQGRLSAFMLSRARKAAALEAAAMRVQTAWRRRQGKLSAMVLKQARSVRRREMEVAARYLQRVYRGHRGRRMFVALLDHIAVLKLKKGDLQTWAATVVQKHWRGKLGRRRFRKVMKRHKRRWKEMWDESTQRVFYYDKNTGDIRWRKPQEVLDLMPVPKCNNCEQSDAVVECGDCSEYYCQVCWDSVHFGGKRKAHEFRALFDIYGKRVDYGDGEWPSKWPSEIEQDEFLGWHEASAEAKAAYAAGGAGAMVEHQPWTRYDDPSSGQYYHNADTGHSTYRRPAEYSTPRPEDGVLVETGERQWQKYYDAESGRDFYYNQFTMESTCVPCRCALARVRQRVLTPIRGCVAVCAGSIALWILPHHVFRRATRLWRWVSTTGPSTGTKTPAGSFTTTPSPGSQRTTAPSSSARLAWSRRRRWKRETTTGRSTSTRSPTWSSTTTT